MWLWCGLRHFARAVAHNKSVIDGITTITDAIFDHYTVAVNELNGSAPLVFHIYCLSTVQQEYIGLMVARRSYNVDS